MIDVIDSLLFLLIAMWVFDWFRWQVPDETNGYHIEDLHHLEYFMINIMW